MGLGFSGMSRRQFVAMVAAAGGVPVLDAIAGPIIDRAFAADPAGTGSLSDIEHFVFLMQENRSFDHYFGTMSAVRGFGDPTGNFAQRGFDITTGKASNTGVVLPFRLNTTSPITNDGECITDPTHDWGPQHQAWNGGAMDQWVKVHVANDGVKAGPATMGYYTQQDIPVHWALANAFTVCDHYFCSVLGPTDPNRLYWISGTIDPDGQHGGPLLYTPTTVPSNKYSWLTYPEALQQAGVSWKVYADQSLGPVSQAVLSGMLSAFKNFQNPNTELYKRGIKPTFPGNFKTDVANNTLPAVSWIIPNLLNCEHPALPPAFGAAGILQVLNILTSKPAVWEKTALIISYDENGGFFDHVAPPTAPPGTPGEYVTVPLAGVTDSDGIAGPIGLGFRVPGLVISPYSRGGLLASDTFDHTSQLRLIETRFGVEVPNLTAWRRGVVGDMTSTFNFAAPRNTSSQLQSRVTNEAGALLECRLGLDTLSGTFLNGALGGDYAPPKVNTMPVQKTTPPRATPSGPVGASSTAKPTALGLNEPVPVTQVARRRTRVAAEGDRLRSPSAGV